MDQTGSAMVPALMMFNCNLTMSAWLHETRVKDHKSVYGFLIANDISGLSETMKCEKFSTVYCLFSVTANVLKFC